VSTPQVGLRGLNFVGAARIFSPVLVRRWISRSKDPLAPGCFPSCLPLLPCIGPRIPAVIAMSEFV
jgi:hypothetical protein